MGEMEIMNNINYKQYLDMINQYENDIEVLEREESQLIEEVKNIEDIESKTIQERKEKSKKLIEKRSELEVTSEALKSLKNEYEEYCKNNKEVVRDVITELRNHIQYNKEKRRKEIDKEIKDFAKKIFVKIKKETEEQITLKNEVDEIYCELVKISEYGKTSFLPSIAIFGFGYSDMYTEDIFISELKRLALD